jgi:hypothetical protein
MRELDTYVSLVLRTEDDRLEVQYASTSTTYVVVDPKILHVWHADNRVFEKKKREAHKNMQTQTPFFPASDGRTLKGTETLTFWRKTGPWTSVVP